MINLKDPKKGFHFHVFYPILAGATLRERLLACLGALFGIKLTGLICGTIFGAGPYLPLIVAPMGASAVLLFAVPTSPLAQPWPIIGGNTISALMGVIAGSFIHDPIIAIGVGVSLAIGAMSRDVIVVGQNSTASEARDLLLKHNIRTLPVIDNDHRLICAVRLRELSDNDDSVASAIPILTDGRSHAAIVVDEDRHMVGFISQTDLLSVIARALSSAVVPQAAKQPV